MKVYAKLFCLFWTSQNPAAVSTKSCRRSLSSCFLLTFLGFRLVLYIIWRTFPTLIMISLRSTCAGYKAGAMPNQSVPVFLTEQIAVCPGPKISGTWHDMAEDSMAWNRIGWQLSLMQLSMGNTQAQDSFHPSNAAPGTYWCAKEGDMCNCKGEITYSRELFDGHVYTVPEAERAYKDTQQIRENLSFVLLVDILSISWNNMKCGPGVTEGAVRWHSWQFVSQNIGQPSHSRSFFPR